MNRRHFLQALGGVLALPYEPKTIYSFPTPKVINPFQEALLLEFGKLAYMKPSRILGRDSAGELGFYGHPPIPAEQARADFERMMRFSQKVLNEILMQGYITRDLLNAQFQAVLPTNPPSRLLMRVKSDGHLEAHALHRLEREREGGGLPGRPEAHRLHHPQPAIEEAEVPVLGV